MTENLKIVIPMAGLGSRLRPLTWSRPKPLISLAGATVLDHLLRMFETVPDADRADYIFIISHAEALSAPQSSLRDPAGDERPV